MRVKDSLLCFGVTMSILACLPKPDQDFEDYTKRANALGPGAAIEAGAFEAAAPPAEAVNGLYYGECLSQLAFGNPSDVLSFYTESKFVPEAGGGRLSLVLQPLQLGPDQNPPTTIAKAGVVGAIVTFNASAPNVAAGDGRFTAALGTVAVPKEANPITGRNIVINNAVLSGFFGKDRFCARLSGDLVQPVEATLEPPRNICQFYAIKDGDPRPTYKVEEFQAESCPF